jgi:mannose-6-phosphate isomerase-like protein (cupin superfamily)
MLNQTVVTTNWLERGFSCDLWTDPPGRCWENFTHAVDELVMVLAGEVEFEIDGRIHHPAVGEELLIPAGTRHSVRNRGRTTARWLYGYRRR